MKSRQSASFGRNSVANVVFPAPFGPAIMNIRFSVSSATGSLHLFELLHAPRPFSLHTHCLRAPPHMQGQPRLKKEGLLQMRKTTACKLSLIGRKNSSFLSRNSPPTGATADFALVLPTIPHFSIGIDPQGGSDKNLFDSKRAIPLPRSEEFLPPRSEFTPKAHRLPLWYKQNPMGTGRFHTSPPAGTNHPRGIHGAGFMNP